MTARRSKDLKDELDGMAFKGDKKSVQKQEEQRRRLMNLLEFVPDNVTIDVTNANKTEMDLLKEYEKAIKNAIQKNTMSVRAKLGGFKERMTES